MNMFCENCGKQIPCNAKFCENCGTKVTQSEATSEYKPAGGSITISGSGDIKLCPDGKYRWYYEFPMLKNPQILFTIWKVMLIAAIAPGLLVFLSGFADGFIQAIKQFIIVCAIVFGVMFVLSCISYFIIAAIYGFKYIVLFEMCDEYVTHAQQDKQFKKTDAINWIVILMGTAKGKPGVIGTGLLAGSKQKITSEFKNVSTVIGLKKRNTIKVNQSLTKNQVYVKPEDYDFVWDYITSHCKKAKIKHKNQT